MSEDPAGLGGKDLNLFRIAKSNPLRFIDPTGLTIIDTSGLVPPSVKATQYYKEMDANANITLNIASSYNIYLPRFDSKGNPTSGSAAIAYFYALTNTSGNIILDRLDLSGSSLAHDFVMHELEHAYSYFVLGSANGYHVTWNDETEGSKACVE